MPPKGDRQHRHYFYPIDPPSDMANAANWNNICIVAPEPLVSYLLPLMKIYKWDGRVNGTDADKQLFVELWTDLEARIVNAAACGMNFKLKQNDANSCQLMQSLDGGNTWSLAFDYSLCRTRNVNIEIETESNIQNIFNDYSTHTTNNEYHPSAPPETGTYTAGANANEQEWRRRALCYASGVFVETFYATIKQAIEDRANRASLVTAVIGLVGAAAALFTGGTSLAIAAALASAILGVSTALYENLSMETINDATGKDQLKCCFYNQFKTKNATQAAWGFSKTACTLNTNGNAMATILETVIVEPNFKDEMFGAFITALGEGYILAQAGILPACDCGDEPWEYIANIAELSAWSARSTIPDRGSYSASGWGAGTVQPGRGHFGIIFHGPATITEIEIRRTALITGTTKQIWVGNMTAPNVVSAMQQRTQTALEEKFVVSQSWSGIFVGQFMSSNTQTPALNGFVNRVIVRGLGANPFA